VAHGILQRLHTEADVCSAGVRSASVVKKLHIGFDDPDAFTGPEDEILSEMSKI
jgi:hypothetical protein